MNIQNLMKQAQQMQKDLQKTQKLLEETTYEVTSSLVYVKINGAKEILKIEIKDKENLEKEDLEILEDMIVVAVNDAMKKADSDKESKLSKYQGLSGLM